MQPSQSFIVDDSKVLFQYPFCNIQDERLDNLKISTLYANRQLTKNSKCIIIESTNDGVSKLNTPSINGFEVIPYKEERFSISKCRNKIINYARENKFDFLVMIDADVLVEKNQIEKTIKHLSNAKCPLAYPFNGHFFNVTRLDVQDLPEFNKIDLSKQVDLNPPGQAPGGYIVLNMKNLHKKTSFYEGFSGWGFEDTQFLNLVRKEYGNPGRIMDVPVIHLDHARNTTHYSMNDAIANQKIYNQMFAGFKIDGKGFYEIE